MAIFTKDDPDNLYGYYKDDQGNQYTVIKQTWTEKITFQGLSSSPSALSPHGDFTLPDGTKLLSHQDGFIISGTNIIIRPL